MRIKIIEVTITCHTCHKHCVRRAVDTEELIVDDLINDTVEQLQTTRQCPHDKSSLQIDVSETREKPQRKKVRYV